MPTNKPRQTVVFTEPQMKALQRRAREEGTSVSSLIRRAAIQHFRLPIEAPQQSMAQLYLKAEDDRVLARLWNNDYDTAYDDL